MRKERSVTTKSWLKPALLLAVLFGLLLLGSLVDRLPRTPDAVYGPALGGWRRRAMESQGALFEEAAGIDRLVIHPPTGIYERSLHVELRATDRRATVIFTTDGSLPTPQHGSIYHRRLHLDVQEPGVTVIRAIEVRDGIPSADVTAVYAIGLDPHLPVLSLVAQPEDLWGSEEGVLANPSFRGRDWERSVWINFLEEQRGFSVPAGLRVHGRSEPLDAPKQSLRLYFRSSYGASRLEYPLFPGHPEKPEMVQSFDSLLLQAGDRDGWWTLFRDELVAQTAQSLDLPIAQGRFVHVFLNGASWGIYRLTERVDRAFLEDAYGYRNADVVQEGAPREGDDADWDALVDWAIAHNLAETSAFAYVGNRLDLTNYIDYAILQLYFGFSAEDLYAVRDQGGRWHYVYAGGAQAFAQRPEEPVHALKMEETDFAQLLRALMANPGFRNQLQSRVIDLLNTTLASESMEQRVAALAENLSADIEYESARWATPTEWADNVALLHEFTAARPAELRAHIGNTLGLHETAIVRLQCEPPEGGRVFVGGLPLDGMGIYYVGTTVSFTAVPNSGFRFAGWSDALPAHNAAGVDTVAELSVEGPEEIAASFIAVENNEPTIFPNDIVISEYWINDNGTAYSSLGGRHLTGDWIELLVRRPAMVDLRGWRLTDNDTLAGSDEGSLIFPCLDTFAAVPRGTVILIIATENRENAAQFPMDDLDARDGTMLIYVGNGNLDNMTDPGFAIGTRNDNLVLLAPRQVGQYQPGEEYGVEFLAEGRSVTPYSFGILNDGVVFENPFRHLGSDDGAVFVGIVANDDGAHNWIVDASACASGDEVCLDAVNILTPGALTAQQQLAFWWADLTQK